MRCAWCRNPHDARRSIYLRIPWMEESRRFDLCCKRCMMDMLSANGENAQDALLADSDRLFDCRQHAATRRMDSPQLGCGHTRQSNWEKYRSMSFEDARPAERRNADAQDKSAPTGSVAEPEPRARESGWDRKRVQGHEGHSEKRHQSSRDDHGRHRRSSSGGRSYRASVSSASLDDASQRTIALKADERPRDVGQDREAFANE